MNLPDCVEKLKNKDAKLVFFSFFFLPKHPPFFEESRSTLYKLNDLLSESIRGNAVRFRKKDLKPIELCYYDRSLSH